jgi:hypothetical protein
MTVTITVRAVTETIAYTLKICHFSHYREAFFGGRTNATKLAYKVDPEKSESVLYSDFTSLYPA